MDLARDAFTVSYDAATVEVDDILNRVKRAGFFAQVTSEAARADPQDGDRGALPAPVAAAVRRARCDDRLVLVKFFAAWCAPCQDLESNALAGKRVLAALESYDVLRIDTDVDTETSARLAIVGLPTLVVFDGSGREIHRHVGGIESDALAEVLETLAAGQVSGRSKEKQRCE